MSDFKELVKGYIGVINEGNEVYSGRAIKFSDAINRLVNLGIPREKAVIAVKQAVADKSKINQIADRICCECTDDEIYESDGTPKNNKIKKTVAGILMAAALGATAGGIRNTMKTSYKNGLEYKEQMNKNYPAYYTDVIPGGPWYNSSPDYANGKERMEALSHQKNRNQHYIDMAEKAAAREGYHNSVRIKIDDLDYEQYDKLYKKVLGKFNSDLSDELRNGGDGSKSVKEYISNMKKILDDESFKLLETKRSLNNDARIKSRDEKDKYFEKAKECEDQIKEIEKELKPLQYKLKEIEQNEKNNFGNKIIGVRSLKKYAYNKGKNE